VVTDKRKRPSRWYGFGSRKYIVNVRRLDLLRRTAKKNFARRGEHVTLSFAQEGRSAHTRNNCPPDPRSGSALAAAPTFLDLLSHATLTTVLDSANGAHESGQAQAERYK
jgi:hypothetical protein